ncbi:Extracellular superoxide dismutase [Cu-Zn] [Toxocara canis]|uniref:Superoxide dismutase [Cu-Zn] n=1 Tax=Toxocara canis TaxID=6265 RepID=A0A0B2VWG4_TOXCA|nr:Extracellular superoxide dismutase [Cu-Zn] [Toxocara canis]
MHVATFILLLSFVSFSSSQMAALRGRAYVFTAQANNNNPFPLAGILDFTENNEILTVSGSVSGLTAGQMHGFHVHAVGDIGNSCNAALGHYNPLGRTHGGPGQPFPTIRHVGDLGNVQASAAGVANINANFRRVGLSGPFSIFGRAIVVHAMQDDLGLGGVPASLTTGNAGARVACGIIGRLVRYNCSFKNTDSSELVVAIIS